MSFGARAAANQSKAARRALRYSPRPRLRPRPPGCRSDPWRNPIRPKQTPPLQSSPSQTKADQTPPSQTPQTPNCPPNTSHPHTQLHKTGPINHRPVPGCLACTSSELLRHAPPRSLSSHTLGCIGWTSQPSKKPTQDNPRDRRGRPGPAEPRNPQVSSRPAAPYRRLRRLAGPRMGLRPPGPWPGNVAGQAGQIYGLITKTKIFVNQAKTNNR